MKAYVSAMATRAGESSFGRWCGRVGDVIDCAIPITLTGMIVVSFALIAFGVVR
jgi:uncharacterized protein YqgC (DUF456 family)